MESIRSNLMAVRRTFAASTRARILFWSTLIALFCGVFELGAPLERSLHTIRDAIRAHPSDGRTVVVEINNRTLREVPGWGVRRSLDARTVDALFALGARKVLFDKVYADPSPAGDDAVFAAALARHRGRVFLATRFDVSGSSREVEVLQPIALLTSAASLGSVVTWRDWLGFTSGVPFSTRVGDKLYPSFSSILSGVYSRRTDLFTPDYAIQYKTVPTVNLADLLGGRVPAGSIAGKDVTIARTSDSFTDTHSLPGQGLAPGIFVLILGAETLRDAVPVNIGWLPALLITFAACLIILHSRRRQVRYATMAAVPLLLMFGPVLLDGRQIGSQVCPALLLWGLVSVRARILNRAATNGLTGLPTFDSILRDGSTCAVTLVGMKIGNYADLRATLNDVEERVLLAEVIRRLRVSGELSDLMQRDEIFVWKSPLCVGTALFDHVEGLHALLSSPVSVGERLVDLTVGFGIEDGRDRPMTQRVGSLQVSAGEAVAASVKWRLHDPRLLEDAEFRQSLLSRLDLALVNGEIWVAYQPKLDLRRNRLTGAEALVRWTHPDRGMIPPDRFIPAAEQANRIAGLTFFVLGTAIRDARRLDGLDSDFTIAVNLSVRMLVHPNLPEEIGALLASNGLPPERLTLEITESSEIDPDGPHLAVLRQLRSMGIHVSIDDYGTKFSTLDYVRMLPASEIKIDQRFIGSVHRDRSASIMARSTVELAHSLGMQVVAEGVEEAGTLAALSDMGCDVAQGYLIAKPMPFAALERFVAATKLRRAG
ncbi:diguanylate phosphodiesterase [Sphingomonas gellani]|uniref:Diguanylate phosphodiesterase n=1 Tax=Sphingomonas gellani TaxID=1166340 RepID=A0A1H8DSG5_9SPHN|nr:EAL domain-containing protein [Sphingomonas gellani]SEN10163.1 diguanylate phosphodiesterase [Sphingomonas gellani]